MPLGQTYTCQTACLQFFWSKDFFHASKSLGLVRGSKAQLGDCSKASEREKCSGIAHSHTAAYGMAFAWKPFCFTPRAGVCLILRSSHQNLPGILAQPEFCQSMSKFLGLKQLDFIWKLEWIWVKIKTKKSKLQNVANHYLFFYAHLCKCPSPCFSSPILMEDHENSDEWKVSNMAKVSRSRSRCHVGYFEHSQLFRTMVAQVRSHTANDSWKKLIFLPQIKKIKAREKARKEQKFKRWRVFSCRNSKYMSFTTPGPGRQSYPVSQLPKEELPPWILRLNAKHMPGTMPIMPCMNTQNTHNHCKRQKTSCCKMSTNLCKSHIEHRPAAAMRRVSMANSMRDPRDQKAIWHRGGSPEYRDQGPKIFTFKFVKLQWKNMIRINVGIMSPKYQICYERSGAGHWMW